MTDTGSDMGWLEGWRALVANDPLAREAFTLQTRLAQSQTQSPGAIAQLIERQGQVLLMHAAAQVPFYRRRFAGLDPARIAPGSQAWESLPVLERADLQRYMPQFRAQRLPPGHQILGPVRSSGSTGTFVEALATNITNTWQKALAFRAAVWARRDFSADLAVIRKFSRPSTLPPEGDTADHWADLSGFPFPTGRRHCLEAVGSATHEQIAWLERRRPDYLMTYPSILRDLVAQAASSGGSWRPRGLTTLGETVDDDLRDSVRALWGLGIDDVYSAEECGIIAIQCPSHGRYHLQSEMLHVEVVDQNGRASPPGAEGRILVTTLANMATPLIRYAVGDHAIAGERCGCGRNLPVLERILGRDRNLLVTARGRFWPSFGTRRFRQLAPITAQQFRQTATDRIEVIYVAETDLSDTEEQALREAILEALPVPMEIAFRRVAELRRGPGGKFEIFVSDIA